MLSSSSCEDLRDFLMHPTRTVRWLYALVLNKYVLGK